MVQFNLMYQSDGMEGDIKGSYWVEDHNTIVRNYLTHWFTIDLLSIFPFDSVWIERAQTNTLPPLRPSSSRTDEYIAA